MKKKFKTLLGIASLAAATLIGGTWAMNTNELKTGNEFKTSKYETVLKEVFPSSGSNAWKPGVEAKKEVWLENTGEIPVIVKAIFDQSWVRTEDIYAETAEGPVLVATAGNALPLKFEESGGNWEYAALLKFNKNAVCMLGDGSKTENPDGIPYVASPSNAQGKWLLTSEEPNADGKWEAYYIGVLDPQNATPILLESVTMNPKIENTIISSRTYYDYTAKKWVTEEVTNSKYGYDGAQFTLNVEMLTVQATKNAVDEVFKGPDTEITTYLAELAGSRGYDASGGEKKLTIEESNGKLGYVPQGAGSGTENGNWFMSFTDMLPGETYKDALAIKNATDQNFYVYMQVVEREQGQIPAELLEKIGMKVFLVQDGKETLIYDGKATGFTDASGKNLQKALNLGLYGSGANAVIRTEMTLDPSLTLETDGSFKYADVLTKIDWKFWVSIPSKPSGGGGGSTPRKKTEIIHDPVVPLGAVETIEDEMIPLAVLPATGTSWWIVAILTGAAFALVGAGVWRKRKYGKQEE